MPQELLTLVYKIDAKLNALFGMVAIASVSLFRLTLTKEFLMSWTSQFFHSLLNGIIGNPAAVNHNPNSPIAPALNNLNQAGAQLGQTLGQLGISAVNSYLAPHVGQAGTAAADLLLVSLIEAAHQQLTPETQNKVASIGLPGATSADQTPAS